MPDSPFTLALCGGGTGGHIIPALNIGKAILKRKSDIKIVYTGSKNSLEERLATVQGYPFLAVKTAYLRRSLSLKNIILPFIALTGLVQAIHHLRAQKVNFVLGTGGFSSWSTLTAARVLGIPYVLQEQNAFPGLVIRMTARGAKRIYLGYEAAAARLNVNPENIMNTGNPVQTGDHRLDKSSARKTLGLDEKKSTIFITGGSGGALTINNSVEEIKEELLKKEFNLIWQVGKNYSGDVNTDKTQRGDLYKDRFLNAEQMNLAYSAADLVVSRCGAMTLAEIASHGLPAILVPYPFAADGHQEANGRAVEGAGAAVMILNKDMNGEKLLAQIDEIFHNSRLADMSARMKDLAMPDATDIIADDIMKIAQC